MSSRYGMVMLVNHKMSPFGGEMALLVEGSVRGDGQEWGVGWVRGKNGGREKLCKMRQMVCYLDLAGLNCCANREGRWCGWDWRALGRSLSLAFTLERWWTYESSL